MLFLVVAMLLLGGCLAVSRWFLGGCYADSRQLVCCFLVVSKLFLCVSQAVYSWLL